MDCNSSRLDLYSKFYILWPLYIFKSTQYSEFDIEEEAFSRMKSEKYKRANRIVVTKISYLFHDKCEAISIMFYHLTAMSPRLVLRYEFGLLMRKVTGHRCFTKSSLFCVKINIPKLYGFSFSVLNFGNISWNYHHFPASCVMNLSCDEYEIRKFSENFWYV